MKTINFQNPGGLPVTQRTFEFIQESYGEISAAVATMLGDNAIVSGVNVVGGVVSDGFVTINGELLPFQGGAVGPAVEIVEVQEDRTFEDTVSRPVYFTRFARCAAIGTVLFSALQPAGIVPKGGIMMWSGSVNAIPRGWALCDGNAGRPDLRGRFIVGVQSGDAQFGAIGNTGGQREVALSLNQIPSHSHRVITTGDQTGVDPGRSLQRADNNGDAYQVGSSTLGSYIEPVGGNEAHNNLPPYYVLAYIIKL